jgi:hypothetical protein
VGPPLPPAPYSNWCVKSLYIIVCPFPGNPDESGMELISKALCFIGKSFEKFKLLLIFCIYYFIVIFLVVDYSQL